MDTAMRNSICEQVINRFEKLTTGMNDSDINDCAKKVIRRIYTGFTQPVPFNAEGELQPDIVDPEPLDDDMSNGTDSSQTSSGDDPNDSQSQSQTITPKSIVVESQITPPNSE